jgi:hypothetical protein
MSTKNSLPKCDGRPQLWATPSGTNLLILHPSGRAEVYLEYEGWCVSAFSATSQEAAYKDLIELGHKFLEYL